ncbi:MAG TPA: sigma-70 family RNA polymerase sigma factor [Gemmatimonadaceae bacterium]|nr:sigma-70 family RNA polymerase sigma factor [Gemmatimonadaceae bacterium]
MADAELVRRVLAGEAAAYTALVDRHSRACLRFATRLLGNREDAEDATQEAFLRAYRALGRYEERTAFRTWLFAILVNRCRTALLQRGRRERRVQSDGRLVEHAASPAETPSAELRVELTRALAALAPEQREAFLLKHVEQLEYEEMAAITGAGVSALKMRVQRACARLRESLRDLRDE